MALRGGSWSVFGKKLPEFGITEKIQSVVNPQAARTAQGGSNLFGKNLAATASQQRTYAPPVVTSTPQRSVLGSSTQSSGTYAQTAPTGDFQAATSGEVSGDTSGGDSYDPLAALRDAFNSQRSALEGQLPILESDYNLGKADIEGSVNRAKDTLQSQRAETERGYGQSLKSLLQTDKELRSRRQGTFSALGALDSSAFRDETVKGDQFLQENQLGLQGERDRVLQSADKEYAAFEQKATSDLARYANEFARAKSALQQAVASVNMEEAASIQNYMSQLQERSQAIQDQMNGFKMNLAQLQAQGTDVMGNLAKFNMNDFNKIFGSRLQNQYNSTLSRYGQAGQPQSSMAGYIGRGMTDEQKRQLGLA